MTTRSAVIEV